MQAKLSREAKTKDIFAGLRPPPPPTQFAAGTHNYLKKTHIHKRAKATETVIVAVLYV